MPSQKPVTAGIKDHVPIVSEYSMAGIRRLQMEAATMTPAANPVRALCTNGFSLFFINNTQAEPSVVPRKGIRIPCNTRIYIESSILSPAGGQSL